MNNLLSWADLSWKESWVFPEPSEAETWVSQRLFDGPSSLHGMSKFCVFNKLLLLVCCRSNISLSCFLCSSIQHCKFLWICKAQLRMNFLVFMKFCNMEVHQVHRLIFSDFYWPWELVDLFGLCLSFLNQFTEILT